MMRLPLVAAVWMLLACLAVAADECKALTPGSAPAVYRITLSNGVIARVKQAQPTPEGGNPCFWSGSAERVAYSVMHSNDQTGAPAGGQVGKIPSVWLGIDL